MLDMYSTMNDEVCSSCSIHRKAVYKIRIPHSGIWEYYCIICLGRLARLVTGVLSQVLDREK